MNATLLAFNRNAVLATMTDSCIISRKFVADGSPSISDGRGGSTGGNGQPGVVNGFIDDDEPTACRLLYVPSGRGMGEELSNSIEPFVNANLTLPFDTLVRDADRFKVTEAATGLTKTWEIMNQAPHTEQYSLLVSVRIVGEDLGS